jgi:hypothetical protein
MIFMSSIKQQTSQTHLTGHQTQAGVTLLLSILLLSAISAISFSLAAIVFVEIRASGDVQRTEPALYATQGALEEATFDIKRGAGNAYTPSVNCIMPETCVSLAFVSGYFRDPGTVEKVLSSSTSYENTKNVYYLVDPDDIYADNDGNGSPDGSFAKIKLTNLGSVPVHVSLCEVLINDCITGGTAWDMDTGLAAFGGVAQDDTLSPASSYQLFIYYQGPPQGPPGFVKVETFGPDTTTPRGMPYFGKKKVDITASYLGLTRKYETLIPEE